MVVVLLVEVEEAWTDHMTFCGGALQCTMEHGTEYTVHKNTMYEQFNLIQQLMLPFLIITHHNVLIF